MIRRHGGSSGIRDVGMLKSAIARPFATFGMQDLYQNVYMKAGALIQSIVKNHPFLDGNKRTAYSSSYIFLKKNGVLITTKTKDVISFMIRVANENLSVDEIAIWLAKYSKKI